MVSYGADNSVRLWNLHDGEELARWFMDAAIRTLTISPDEHLLFAGDALGRVMMVTLD
jgi:WD40 repeat protein